MDAFATVEAAVKQRDAEAILKLLFDSAADRVRPNFSTETQLWDFKQGCPAPGKDKENVIGWSHIAADVLAFHNNKGGVLIFGVHDGTFSFCGIKTRLDGKVFNDQIRKFLPDRIWVEFYRVSIRADQAYLGIAIIPPRGPQIERFKADAPDGRYFFRNGAAIRENDSTKILNKEAVDALVQAFSEPLMGRVFAINEPNYRLLQPEYDAFVLRETPCKEIESAMADPRSSVTTVTGVGGTGKTALATWAALRAYQRRDYNFIVSITAKDRELTNEGIRALRPGLTTFESLLDSILEVLGFSDAASASIEDREAEVRDLLEHSKGLLFVDNLETVDDARVIKFLDSLPIGVKALTTSRRAAVRVSAHPVAVGSMTDQEAVIFVTQLANRAGLKYLNELKDAEKVRLVRACDCLPLAIKWTVTRSKTIAEALAISDSITATQKHGEELLEFCFRRLFDSMTGLEKGILEVLSVFQRPLPVEAAIVATNTSAERVTDSLDDLLADSMVNRVFEEERNDYCFTLFPITRAFVHASLNKQPGIADKMRGRLADWFEGKDVQDPEQRLVVRDIRQGKGGSDSALVDLALAAEKRNDLSGAAALYSQALTRNPGSWKAARAYAELFRHKRNDTTNALRYYEQAAANAPFKGPDRALIYREWGMLLRDSGEAQATDRAIDNFEIALKETPNDVLTRHALAHMLMRKGNFGRVKELLAPLMENGSLLTRKKTYLTLLEAYDRSGDMLEAASLKAKFGSDLNEP